MQANMHQYCPLPPAPLPPCRLPRATRRISLTHASRSLGCTTARSASRGRAKARNSFRKPRGTEKPGWTSHLARMWAGAMRIGWQRMGVAQSVWCRMVGTVAAASARVASRTSSSRALAEPVCAPRRPVSERERAAQRSAGPSRRRAHTCDPHRAHTHVTHIANTPCALPALDGGARSFCSVVSWLAGACSLCLGQSVRPQHPLGAMQVQALRWHASASFWPWLPGCCRSLYPSHHRRKPRRLRPATVPIAAAAPTPAAFPAFPTRAPATRSAFGIAHSTEQRTHIFQRWELCHLADQSTHTQGQSACYKMLHT